MAGQPYILVVDDEPDFREIFGAKLSSEGFRVGAAADGPSALDMMAKEAPDLVLMDVNMPGMDGATTVIKMRENPATKNIKVAFLTSLGDPREEIQEVNRKFSQDFGAQGYLKKTDDLDVLVQSIRKFLT